MKKKYRGIILIEVLVALMILLTVSMMAMTSTIAVNKSKVKRAMYGNLERISYCIMNEIKYNYSIQEMKDKMLMDNIGVDNKYSIGFKYTEDMLKKLTVAGFFDLEKGEDIKIEMSTNKNIEDVVNITINIKMDADGEEVSIERAFNKSWWME